MVSYSQVARRRLTSVLPLLAACTAPCHRDYRHPNLRRVGGHHVSAQSMLNAPYEGALNGAATADKSQNLAAAPGLRLSLQKP